MYNKNQKIFTVRPNQYLQLLSFICNIQFYIITKFLLLHVILNFE